MRAAYEYTHVVTFDETNLVGNVYFVNHLRWQGHCREHFLRERAPGVMADLGDSLVLVTTRCSCEYYAELAAFDAVDVRMSLAELAANRITMRFDYVSSGRLVARGEQQVATLRREAEGLVPVPIPEELRAALGPYAAGDAR
jgi:enediyne core biosynthesis thioesterase